MADSNQGKSSTRGSSPQSQASQQKVQAREKEQKALKLRKSGLTYKQIANQIGYADESGARKAVKRVLDRVRDELLEQGAEYLALQRSRLMQLMMTYWTKALQGDKQAAQLCVTIISEHARLSGFGTSKFVREAWRQHEQKKQRADAEEKFEELQDPDRADELIESLKQVGLHNLLSTAQENLREVEEADAEVIDE